MSSLAPAVVAGRDGTPTDQPSLRQMRRALDPGLDHAATAVTQVPGFTKEAAAWLLRRRR